MRLLSYNIHKGIGGRDRRYELERIVKVVEHENPDLICLQEVDRNVRRSKFHDQPKLLAEHFHAADFLYQLNVKLHTGGYGNLIVSRWPILGRHHISLTMLRKKPRGAQLAVVDSPEGPLHLVNWHLGLVEHERHWQVRRLLEHHLFREAGHLPTVVIGDTNDWRNRLADGPFGIHRFTQVTAPSGRFRSFPAWMPVGSLDKAFTRGPIRVVEARVGGGRVARVASDHLPLIVDFHIDPDEPAAAVEQAE